MLATQVVVWETQNMESNPMLPEQMEQVILLIRGQRVMLERDLAGLYGVETKNLNKAVRRNPDRLPADFMFQLTMKEAECLRFQFGSLKRGRHFKHLPSLKTVPLPSQRATLPLIFQPGISKRRGGRRHNPYAFGS